MKKLFTILLILSFCKGFAQVPKSYFGITIIGPTETNINGSGIPTTWPPWFPSAIRLWNNVAYVAAGGGYNGIHWKDIETSEDVYVWAEFDKILLKYKEQGVTDLIYTLGYTPQWAGGGTRYNLPPSDTLYLTNFITTVANRAISLGIPIKYYETWNEPNNGDQLDGYAGTVNQMVVFGKALSNAVKAVNSSYKVISPSTQGYSLTTSTYDPNTSGVASQQGTRWTATYLNAGGVADIHGAHLYMPRHQSDSIINLVDTYQTIYATYGQSGKEMWNTEFFDITTGANMTQKSEFLAKTYLLGWIKGVDRNYYYAWDGGSTTGEEWIYTSGIDSIGKANQQLINWMQGATVDSLVISGNVYTVRIRKDNQPMLAVWNKSGNSTYTTTFPQARNLWGAISAVTGSVTIGKAPILLSNTFHNYYFSSTGNDANTGTSPSSPFKTLTKLNNIWASLNPGDSVLLKRGDTFFGSITVNKSGTLNLPIVIGAYGTGALPIVTSLVTPTWTSLGSNIYESNDLGVTSVRLLLANGVPQGMARYPDPNITDGGFLTIDGATWNSTTLGGVITDAALASAPTLNWQGGTVVRKTKEWVLDNSDITSQTGNNITFQSSGTYGDTPGWGYFIENHNSALSRNGEWTFSSASHKVRYYSSTGSPANIQVPTIGTLLLISNSYINVRNIEFNGSNGQNVTVNGSYNRFSNITVKSSGSIGIKFTGKYNWADSSSVDNSMDIGVNLNYTGSGNKLTNTSVNHSGMLPGMGDVYHGVLANADHDTVWYCTIKNSGTCGIKFGSYDGIDIRYNKIDSFNTVNWDNGGLYTKDRPANDVNGQPVYNVSRVVKNNIIINPLGNGFGTPYPKVTPCHNSMSMYFDNRSSGIEASLNTVGGGDKAMFVNNGGAFLNIHDNNLFGGTYQFQTNPGDLNDKPMMSSNRFSNNVLFATTVTQRTAYYDYTPGSNAWNLESFGKMDTNYHVRPIVGDSLLIKDESPALTLSDFKLAHPTLEVHGHISPVFVTSPTDIRIEWNETTSSITRSLGGPTYSDVYGNTYTSVTLAPFTSIALIKTVASNQRPSVTLVTPANGATYMAPASIAWSATGTDPDGTITSMKLYNGNTLLDVDNTAPYSKILLNVAPGAMSLTAHATDNNGDSTISSAKNITVSAPANTPPTVSISTPTTGAIINLPDSVNITALSTDSDGSVTRVKFYDGITLIHTETIAPYNFKYLFAAGTHTITAVSFDNNGDSSTSTTVSFTVVRQLVPLHIVIVPDSILCNGGTASVDVDAQGGTPPYIGTGSFSRSAGSQQFIIRDSLNVSDTGIVVMTQPAVLSASPPSVGTIPFKSSVAVYISATGGVTPYQYRINNGSGPGPWQNSNAFTVPAGTYIVDVKDKNGCTASTSFTITQTKPGNDKLVNKNQTIYLNQAP